MRKWNFFESIMTLLSVPLLFTTIANAISWPVNPPNQVNPQQRRMYSTFMEYRGRANDSSPTKHFHGGVDVSEPAGTYVYAVDAGKVTRLASNNESDSALEIRTRYFLGDYDTWRYIHILGIQVQLGDSLVTGGACFRTYNSSTGNWEYGTDCPIGWINTEDNHLHFEDAFYTQVPYPNYYHYKFNLLHNDPSIGFKPYTDSDTAVFVSPKFELFDVGIDDEYDADTLEGSGTFSDPFLVYDYIDIRVHSRDRNTFFSGTDPTLGIYACSIAVFDEANVFQHYFIAFKFPYSELTTTPNALLTSGVEYIYDSTVSVVHEGYTSQLYYWMTNTYDNFTYFDGVENTYYSPFALIWDRKYKFKVYLLDLNGTGNNFAVNEFWIHYGATNLSEK